MNIDELLAERDQIGAEIDQVHQQMEPMRERLRSLSSDLRAAEDLACETSDDPLVWLRFHETSQVGYERTRSHLKSLHPTFTDVSIHERLLDGEREMGVNVYIDSRTRAEDIATLPEALLKVAELLCPSPSDDGPFPGTVHARLSDADCGATRSYGLRYTLDGEHATLTSTYTISERAVREGTLVDMVSEAYRVCTLPVDDAPSYY